MRHLYQFLFLALLITIACGGGSDDSKPSPSASTIVNRDQLALMVLSADDLGTDFQRLEIDDESGYLTSNDVASDTIDPRDDAVDIENGGWVASYSLNYEDSTLDLTATVGGGTTSLDLFEDADSADAFLEKQLSDADDLSGSTIQSGFVLEEAGQFEVSAADGGFGLKQTMKFGQPTVYGWVAGFRLGNLVAAVAVTRLDDTDITETMRQLTAKLEQRVNDVLAGSAQIEAVPLPTKEPDAPGQAERPATGPFLDQMSLTLNDLPDGSTIDEEGYVPDEDSVAYQRSFDLGPPASGTAPFSLEVRLNLFSSEALASAQFAGLRGVYLGESSQEFFDGVYSSQPFEVSNVEATEVPVTTIGDDTFAVAVAYDMPFGRVENDFVYVRVGEVIAALLLSGFAGETDHAYVDAQLAKLTERIEAELGTS